MATIRPFRGLRYDVRAVRDLSLVIAQPYDRIHAAEQAAYYALHPHNFVRIDMGRVDPDKPDDNVYTRARGCAWSWLAEGVLVREPRLSIYAVQQAFASPDGRRRARLGFTAALELARFDEGIIRPHERTLSGPKTDRLNLTRATQTAWGHIFVLYPDPDNEISGLLESVAPAQDPIVARERVIEPEVEQRFWVVDDPGVIAAVAERMAPKRNLIIADGHHRYETALTYRDEMRARHPGAPADAGFNHALVTFASMSDPGLVILPTHRLVHSYTRLSGEQMAAALSPYFDAQPVADRAALFDALAGADAALPRFGFYRPQSFMVLTLRSLDAMAQLAPDHAPMWRALDVSTLHKIVLEHVMGLTPESIARQENIRYLRDACAGFEAVDKGEADFLFILNPTRMDQVRACTEAAEIMPQKSTDFYPKIVSGWVSMPLDGTL